ncbi:MAG: exodeoxyribonuclease V alpha subunit [Bradymonadia bacterium]
MLERVLFSSDDGAFQVAFVRPDVGDPVKAVGALSGLAPGERVRLIGRRIHSQKFGAQFRVTAAYPVLPHSEDGVRRYLASGRVSGIGKQLAARLVAAFGAQTFDVILTTPERLAEVPGIGPKRCAELATAFVEQVARREAMIFLQGLGASSRAVQAIWQAHGANAIQHVRHNPYRLAEEISGIGFRSADGFARHLGFDPDDPARIAAAVVHLLNRAAEDGHVYLPRDTLATQAEGLLGTSAQAIIDTLIAEGRLVDGGHDRLALRHMDLGEAEIATRIAERLAVQGPPLPVDLDALAATTNLRLAPAQSEAVQVAAEASLMLLTGGPGTGKTTIVQAILHVFDALTGPVLLAAPTGRAAKRLSEACGRDASTLHRLLEYSPREGFKRGRDRPLEAAALIIDEASMIDQALMIAVLRALPADARLILVGDADQLPSVGPGQVLGDLLAVEEVPAVRLREVFRQARTSQIVAAAHAVQSGEMPPVAPSGADTDFFIVWAQDADEAATLIDTMIAERIPQAFGIASADVQVLTPMHRGTCGAQNLNTRLQARLNPNGNVLRLAARELRVGDRVMQVRNDYEREVYNGDLGRVQGFNTDGVSVEFGGRAVDYPRLGLDAVQLAYACSVHKSQGSEYPAVILPVLDEHWMMLQRNLLYTALTRGRRLVVLVAQRRALHRAVRNTKGTERFTRLAERLRARI